MAVKRVIETDLFLVASSVRQLEEAWHRVRINRGGPGSDHVSVDQFEKNAPSRLSSLSHVLRNGSYRPSPSRRVYIPKKSGDFRPLDIPTVADRIIQTSVAQVLNPILEPEFEDSSFGYRPGRGVADAVQLVARHRRNGFKWVVDADIRRYFEEVGHERLLNTLEGHVASERLLDLVTLWLEWYQPSGRGLPQGSPLSPLLANLYLDRLDEAMEGRGIRLVRYADDFVLLCKSEAIARRALEKADEELLAVGLSLNTDKTRVVSFDQGFRFLGHVFVRSLAFKDMVDDTTPDAASLVAAEKALENLSLQKAKGEAFGVLQGEKQADEEAKPDPSLSMRWRTLYVLEPKRKLSANGGNFRVMEGDVQVLSVPARRIGRIEVGKAAKIGTKALDLAGENGITISRLNGYGAPLAKWVAPVNSHATRHYAQAAIALAPERRLAFSRSIVAAKIANQRALLKRTSRKCSDEIVLGEVANVSTRFRRLIRYATYAKDINTLLGHEGEAAKLYWPCLARLAPNGWDLPKRARSPASSPLDVALNITAHLLASDIEVALRRCQLHPGFGVLHRPQDHADALVFDLMEEFRGAVAEACILPAIGRNAIRADMFEFYRGSGWAIKRDGYSAVVRAYETHIARSIIDPVAGKKVVWKGLFERQAERFALFCETGDEYLPYKMDY